MTSDPSILKRLAHTYQFSDTPGKCKDCRQGVFHAIHQSKIPTPIMDTTPDLNRLFKAMAFAVDYSDQELRIMASVYRPFTTTAFQEAIGLGRNPLDNVRVRASLGEVLKHQATHGPFPITTAILDAIWNALKEEAK